MVAMPRAQHSPMFGQAASWQTVWRLFSERFLRSVLYASPPGSLARSQAGFRLSARWWAGESSLLRIMLERETRGVSLLRMGSPPRGLGCLWGGLEGGVGWEPGIGNEYRSAVGRGVDGVVS